MRKSALIFSLLFATSQISFSQLIQQSINRSYNSEKAGPDFLRIDAGRYINNTNWFNETPLLKNVSLNAEDTLNKVNILTRLDFTTSGGFKKYLIARTKDLRRIKKLISERTDKNISIYDSVSKLIYSNINSVANELLIKKTVYDELKDTAAKTLYTKVFKSIHDSCDYNLRRIENTIFQLDKLKDINNGTKNITIDTLGISDSSQWKPLSENFTTIETGLNNPRVKILDSIIRSQILQTNVSFDSIMSKIGDLNKKVESTRNKEEENTLQLGSDNSINALVGESRLVPQISILAAQNIGKGDMKTTGQISSFQAKIYSGGTANDLDSSNIKNLFLPEASSLGINIEFDKAWALKLNDDRVGAKDGSPAFGFNFGIGYLLKSHKLDSALSSKLKKEKETFGAIQGRFGIQLILLKNYISFYASQNFMFIGENVAGFESYYDNQKKLKWFTDLGFKFYAPLVKDKSLNIQIDTRFIINGRDLKDLTKREDSFLPRIQIGFVKEFSPFR